MFYYHLNAGYSNSGVGFRQDIGRVSIKCKALNICGTFANLSQGAKNGAFKPGYY